MKMQFCGFEAILMIMLRCAVIKRRAHPCRETVMAAEDVALGLDPQSVAAEMAEGIMDHQTTDKATEVMLTREAGIAAHQEKGIYSLCSSDRWILILIDHQRYILVARELTLLSFAQIDHDLIAIARSHFP